MAIIPKPLRELKGHKGAVYAVRFNEKGTYCMTCSQDRTIRLWNPHRDDINGNGGALFVKEYKGPHGYDVQDIAISTDNATFASCGGDKSIFLWDVASGRVIRRFQAHEHRINAVRYNNDCSVLLSASYDRSIRAWDIRSRGSFAPIQVLEGFKDSVTSVIATNYEILGSSVDGTVKTFDIRAGRMIVDDFHESVSSLSISNDKNCLLVSCLDASLKLLERSSGSQLNTYKGHKNKNFSLECCFTSTDAHVVSGSEDGNIHFWNLVEGDCLLSYSAHESTVGSLAYHPTDSYLLSASHDGTAKFWDMGSYLSNS